MKFNLINPSDAYHFEADDLEIAAVVACILGGGKYAADSIGAGASKENTVPPFLFGGHDEWFREKFGRTFEATVEHCMNTRNEVLAKSLDSVTLTRPPRSSMNDIGGRAKAYAASLRQSAPRVQDCTDAASAAGVGSGA